MPKFLNRFDKGSKITKVTKIGKGSKKTVVKDNTKLTANQKYNLAKEKIKSSGIGGQTKKVLSGAGDIVSRVLVPEALQNSNVQTYNAVIAGKAPAADGTYNASTGATNTGNTTEMYN